VAARSSERILIRFLKNPWRRRKEAISIYQTWIEIIRILVRAWRKLKTGWSIPKNPERDRICVGMLRKEDFFF